MSDPPRLLETASLEADLLDAWSSQRAPADARAKAFALGATAAAAVAAKTAAVSATAKVAAGASAGTTLGASTASVATTGLFAAKWLAALGVVAAVGGGSLAVHHYVIAPSTSETAPARPTTESRAVPRSPDVENAAPANTTGAETAAIPEGPATTAPSAGAGSTRVAVVKDGRSTAARPSDVVKAAPASSLAGEVSSLDAARESLRAGQASTSLRELDAFDTRYPDSPLAEDAAFLRFDAYVALGDTAGATRTANAVAAKYPSSPRAAKVRRWLDARR